MANANRNGEPELLMQINQRLPANLQARFDTLATRRRDEILTTEEHEELLRLTERVERRDVIRIKAFAQLAQLHGITLTELMKQLSIRAPECIRQ